MATWEFTSDVFWFYNVRKNDGNAGVDPEFTNPLRGEGEGGSPVLWQNFVSVSRKKRYLFLYMYVLWNFNQSTECEGVMEFPLFYFNVGPFVGPFGTWKPWIWNKFGWYGERISYFHCRSTTGMRLIYIVHIFLGILNVKKNVRTPRHFKMTSFNANTES